MRTFRIYSLNNFPIYPSAVETLVIMLDITSPVLIYLVTGSLDLSNSFIQFPLPPPPPSEYDLFFYWFVFCSFKIFLFVF